MIGNIYISGLIGSIEDEKGIELIDIVEQVRKQPEAKLFNVYLNNTEGGVVQVGDDIYDYLSSLDKKTPVTTIAKGLCASISTKIFMAGSKRVIYEDCKFMIHLPMLTAEYLNSNELELATKEIKDLDSEMVDFYSKATGTEKEAIYPLMRNETYLTPDQAVNLGFATEKRQPVKAVAYYNKNNKEMSEQALSQENKTWLENQFEAFKTTMTNLIKKEVVNLTLQDENGMDVFFPDLEDGQTPSVGDIATVDGQPAEGSYIMPSLGGITAVFVGGALTEIIEPSEGESEEIAALTEQVKELQEELATAKSGLTEKDEAFAKIEKEFTNLKRGISSRFELNPKKQKEVEAETTMVDHAKAGLKKLKESRNKRR